MRVLSVDLGTSNTVAVLSVPGMFPRLVDVDGASVMPSAVFAGEDGRLVVGREALRLARTRPERFEANPKRRIDDGELLLGDQVVPVVRAFTSVLARVADEARRQLDGGGFDDVRLTHPASWGLVRRRVLIDAARCAGLTSDPVLIAEPVAAAAHFAAVRRPLEPGEAIAVYDLGAGTFDVAVVGRTAAGFEVLAEGGLAEFGGVDIDQALLDHVGRHAASRDEQAWLRMLRPQSLSDRRARRALLSDVTAAKESLSHHEQTEVVLPDPFEDVLVTRGEFEELVRPALSRSVEVLATTIRAAARTPQTLAGIYLVGGSSRIPLAAKLIAQQFGVVPTTLDQPETTVALGAHHAVEAPMAASVAVQAKPSVTPPPPSVPELEAQPKQPPSRLARITGTAALVGGILLLLGLFLNYMTLTEVDCYAGDACTTAERDFILGAHTHWAFCWWGLVVVVAAGFMWWRSATGPGLVIGTATAAVWALLAILWLQDAKAWGYADSTYTYDGGATTYSYSSAVGPGFWIELSAGVVLIVAGIGAAVTVARDRDRRVRFRMPHDMVLIGTCLVAIAAAVTFALAPTMSARFWLPAALVLVVPVLAVLLVPRRFGAAILLGWAVGCAAIATAFYLDTDRVTWPGAVMTGSFVVLALLGAVLLRSRQDREIHSFRAAGVKPARR